VELMGLASPTLQNLLTQTGILPSAFLLRFKPTLVGSRPAPKKIKTPINGV